MRTGFVINFLSVASCFLTVGFMVIWLVALLLQVDNNNNKRDVGMVI